MRNSTSRLIGAVVVIFILMGFHQAQASGVEIALGGWHQDPGGTLGYKAVSPNDLLDVDNDLKYDTENRVHARAKIELPAFLPNIYLVAAPAEFDGTGRKDVSFTFGNDTFSAGADFYSKLKINQYDIGLYYGLPFIRTATSDMLNIDLGLDVRIYDLEAEVRQADTGIDEKHSLTVGLPLLYVGMQLQPLEWLAFEAEARGLSVGSDKVYSLMGRVRLHVAGPVFIAGGYRYDKIDVDEEDLAIDFDLKGPFAEVGVKF